MDSQPNKLLPQPVKYDLVSEPTFKDYRFGRIQIMIERRPHKFLLEVRTEGGRGGVMVMIDRSLHDDGWERPRISWSSTGAVSVESAELFQKALTTAMVLAQIEWSKIPESAYSNRQRD